MADLEYDPATLLPPCPPERLGKFEEWLRWYWAADVRLPRAYTDHVQRHHGGCPGKACFRTAAGRPRMVGRFFNYLEEGDLPPLEASWREWSGESDVRLDYRVEGFLDYEFWCVRLEQAGHVPGVERAARNLLHLLCQEIDLLAPEVVHLVRLERQRAPRRY